MGWASTSTRTRPGRDRPVTPSRTIAIFGEPAFSVKPTSDGPGSAAAPAVILSAEFFDVILSGRQATKDLARIASNANKLHHCLAEHHRISNLAPDTLK